MDDLREKEWTYQKYEYSPEQLDKLKKRLQKDVLSKFEEQFEDLTKDYEQVSI